ncbi:lipoprotein [Pseudomonas laurentiana]|nr:lipoprotein [Pseudomonas laurentiana]
MTRSINRLRFHFTFLMIALAALVGCQSVPPKGLSAEQVALLKQEGFVLTDEGWMFGVPGKVLFGSDLDSLNTQSREIVARIGTSLLSVDIQRVRVDGHTDSLGQAAYNDQLSVRRAASVAKVLIAVGMRPENVETRGLGSREPVASNHTATGRMENRRVAIVVASN